MHCVDFKSEKCIQQEDTFIKLGLFSQKLILNNPYFWLIHKTQYSLRKTDCKTSITFDEPRENRSMRTRRPVTDSRDNCAIEPRRSPKLAWHLADAHTHTHTNRRHSDTSCLYTRMTTYYICAPHHQQGERHPKRCLHPGSSRSVGKSWNGISRIFYEPNSSLGCAVYVPSGCCAPLLYTILPPQTKHARIWMGNEWWVCWAFPILALMCFSHVLSVLQQNRTHTQAYFEAKKSLVPMQRANQRHLSHRWTWGAI